MLEIAIAYCFLIVAMALPATMLFFICSMWDIQNNKIIKKFHRSTHFIGRKVLRNAAICQFGQTIYLIILAAFQTLTLCGSIKFVDNKT